MTHNDYKVNYHIAKARKRQKQEERIRAIAKGGITIIGIIVLAVLLYGAAHNDGEYIEGTVIVESGDTLWSIARENKADDMDIREYVKVTKRENGLHSDEIYPGNVLNIRRYK